jgi:hypothetical protein
VTGGSLYDGHGSPDEGTLRMASTACAARRGCRTTSGRRRRLSRCALTVAAPSVTATPGNPFRVQRRSLVLVSTRMRRIVPARRPRLALPLTTSEGPSQRDTLVGGAAPERSGSGG